MAKLPVPFKKWTTYKGHSGIDFPQPNGTPFYASGDGVVGLLRTTANGGNMIWVDYADIPKGYGVGYAHMNSFAGCPPVGTRVKRGDLLGYVGYAGHVVPAGPNGSHLHIEIANQPGGDNVWKYFDPNQVVTAGSGAGVGSSQRQVGPGGANQRPQPSTSSASSNTLPPGTVGDFDGWIHGENVQGQDVWFHGALSGLWSWAGGFTDQGTHDLKDMNVPKPPTVGPQQRQVGPNGANGRQTPAAAGNPTQTLPPGTIGDFNGWITGQNVEGQDTWFRGARSGDFFWAGGFTDQGTHDLPSLNPAPQPPVDEHPTRVVGQNAANVRSTPYTSAPVVRSEPSGTTVTVDGYALGDAVQGIAYWLHRADGAGWMWAGGFTVATIQGLPVLAAPPRPTPPAPDNPRGLTEYPPLYPRATKGLEAPLGFADCSNPVVRSSRKVKGAQSTPTTGIISMLAIHWTGVAGQPDQLDYFSYCNDRDSCPTLYLRQDGSTFEMIRPGAKPASTGPEVNWRSVSVETFANPGMAATAKQIEELAQIAAWLFSFNGKTLDGAPIEFTLDRDHIVGHRDVVTTGTECPGDFIEGQLDAIIARAKEISGGTTPPADVVTIARADAQKMLESADFTSATLRTAMGA